MRVAALVFLLPLVAAAQADRLHEAAQALIDADYSRAHGLAGPLAADGSLPPNQRAEALRIEALATFALGDREAAEQTLLGYLRLVPEAHLDPNLYPPEMVVFFEDVRARHVGELLVAKPRPPRKKTFILNFLPPFGQIQNGDTGRAWLFGGAEVVFLAANVTTYALLRSRCKDDLTCDDPGGARTLRTLNLVAGGLLAATWVAGTVDALVGFPRKVADDTRPRWSFAPAPGGALATISGKF